MSRQWMRLAGLAVTLMIASRASAQAPELPAAGPEHKLLQETVGTWDCKIITAGAPGESVGKSVSKMDLGGLWLVTEFEGDFGGLKFQGHGLDGYDQAKKKYIGIWVDSMSTGPVIMEGDYDAAKKTLTMTGEGPGPTGERVKYKNTTTHADKDHQTFKMSLVEGDKETLMLTIEYSRKK